MHIPVLLNELIEFFKNCEGKTIVDCTGGGGGHAEEILKELNPSRLIILDKDKEAVNRLISKFEDFKNVKVYQKDFSKIKEVLKREGLEKVDGLYADFGVSSFQLTDYERGFSFRLNGDLDMRMDREENDLTAKRIVNEYSKETLMNIIQKYGEERFATRIANAIVKNRQVKPINTTTELAEIVKNAIPKKFHKKGIHPATKTFMAIRIFVNKELESIEMLLKILPEIIEKEGVVAFISFHSLEDRLVKEYLRFYEKDCICPPDVPVCRCDKKREFVVLTKRPVIPSNEEIERNPLSRSAKMRVAKKV